MTPGQPDATPPCFSAPRNGLPARAARFGDGVLTSGHPATPSCSPSPPALGPGQAASVRGG
eukprot:2415017-Pleurochrysis_carterae.AAC.1